MPSDTQLIVCRPFNYRLKNIKIMWLNQPAPINKMSQVLIGWKIPELHFRL
ncbi:hypothetical protein SAMN05421764_12010 [Donghicola eburneus]|nr:hypothetical protein SAMN05421764_12010 [Donghicola eburneus]